MQTHPGGLLFTKFTTSQTLLDIAFPVSTLTQLDTAFSVITILFFLFIDVVPQAWFSVLIPNIVGILKTIISIIAVVLPPQPQIKNVARPTFSLAFCPVLHTQRFSLCQAFKKKRRETSSAELFF